MAQASRSSVTFKLGRKRLHTFVELREPVDVAEEATPKGEVSDALATSADARLRSRRLQDEGNTIAESTGDWHKALLSWQRALELTPQRPELHETMAQAYLQLGDFWKAIACAERAVRGAPLWADAFVTLARAQSEARRHVDAVASYERALQLQPTHESAVAELADARRAAGEVAERQREVQKVALDLLVSTRHDTGLMRRHAQTVSVMKPQGSAQVADRRSGLWGSLDDDDERDNS